MMSQANRLKKQFISYLETLHTSYQNDEDMESIESFVEYVESGKESFRHTVMLFGEEEVKEYDILTIYKFVEGFYFSKYLNRFFNEGNFTLLLEGYVYLLLYQALHAKKKKLAPATLETDLSLLLMFSLTYFPDETDCIGEQLVRVLEDHQKRKIDNPNIAGEFGLSSTVVLASFLAGNYGKTELAESIKSFCKDDIHPAYQAAIDSLWSKEPEGVEQWIGGMVDFHLANSKEDLTLPFHHEEWRYFPIEIISLLELRLKNGLNIDGIENPFLQEFIPLLGTALPVQLEDFTEKLKKRVSK